MTSGNVSQRLVQLLGNEDSNLKFQAALPSKKESSDFILVEKGDSNCITWDTTDTSGNIYRTRRFKIEFKDGVDATAFLLAAFDFDLELAKEILFSKPGERFRPKNRGLPHLAEKDDNAMEVDGEELPPMHYTPYKTAREQYGDDVNIQSQY